MAKKKNPTRLQTLRSHRLVAGFILLAILLPVLVGLIAYRSYQEEQAAERAFQSDKIRFAQIEKDVEAVKANLDPKLQPGDKAEISKSCAYTAAKFEQGTLHCSVNLEVAYANEAVDQIAEIKEAALQTGKFNGKESSESRFKNATGKELTFLELHRSSAKGDFCAVDQIDYGLATYIFSCDRVVIRAVYPIIE